MPTKSESERRLTDAYNTLAANGRIIEPASLRTSDWFYLLDYSEPGHSLPALLRSGEFVRHEADGRLTVRLESPPSAALFPVTATLEALGFPCEVNGRQRLVALVAQIHGIEHRDERRNQMPLQVPTTLPRRRI